MKKVWRNASVWGENCQITAEDGVITEISEQPSRVSDGTDLYGQTVIPGFVDVHAHGCLGYDTMEGHLPEMAAYLAENGTTTWYPTTMTMDKESIRSAVSQPITGFPGAYIPGFHMEGPFIAEKYKGAQNGDFLMAPDLAFFRTLPHVKMVTLAPELAGAAAFIRECGAVVAIGHTSATYEEAKAAIDAGATCLTHTCNAMPPLLHRAPGPIGAGAEKGIYAQVITDGLHIHPAMIHALYRLFGEERFVMISDSMRATGLSDGECPFGGQTVYVKNGEARLADGTLAGSTATLLRCARSMLAFGYSLRQVSRMASENPARLMGIPTGVLRPGYRADFLATDPSLSALNTVVIGGETFR